MHVCSHDSIHHFYYIENVQFTFISVFMEYFLNYKIIIFFYEIHEMINFFTNVD